MEELRRTVARAKAEAVRAKKEAHAAQLAHEGAKEEARREALRTSTEFRQLRDELSQIDAEMRSATLRAAEGCESAGCETRIAQEYSQVRRG